MIDCLTMMVHSETSGQSLVSPSASTSVAQVSHSIISFCIFPLEIFLSAWRTFPFVIPVVSMMHCVTSEFLLPFFKPSLHSRSALSTCFFLHISSNCSLSSLIFCFSLSIISVSGSGSASPSSIWRLLHDCLARPKSSSILRSHSTSSDSMHSIHLLQIKSSAPFFLRAYFALEILFLCSSSGLGLQKHALLFVDDAFDEL
mmetsp:Transcript_39321/g.62296  ORF Transcript_39321/g.62296 Transcript_39321/m.62296 type:complete len:201 (+) Transcript_39321:789-1391(+)